MIPSDRAVGVHALLLLLVIACIESCSALSASVQITSATDGQPTRRVRPGEKIQVVISVEGRTGAMCSGSFDGSAPLWLEMQSASIPQVVRLDGALTMKKNITAPLNEGLYDALSWTVTIHGDPDITVSNVSGPLIEVTCSDGVYCNGIERFVKDGSANQRKCEASIPPCAAPSGDQCSSYQCIESNRSCARTPIGGVNCATCLADACHSSCQKKTCGDDGCGGTCGSCGDVLSCVNGACQQVTQTGTCKVPAILPTPTAAIFGTSVVTVGTGVIPNTGLPWYFVYGDSSQGLDMVQPKCNSPGIGEWVYRFTVNVNMGFEIRMTGPNGENTLDTLLAIHDASCGVLTLTAADRLCSDDQTPPGNLASRVDGLLLPGTYTIIASAYATTSLGPFRLAIKFAPNCVPKCEGKFCGDDGCGGSCSLVGLPPSDCPSGETCNSNSGTCQVAGACTPDCHQAQCGSDGCGGSCGTCKKDKVCDLQQGVCVPVKMCDPFHPVCQGSGSQNSYCGSDCMWHKKNDPAPDFIPNGMEEVLQSAYFEWNTVPESSCALKEGCIRASGERLLFRFDTRIHNIGSADFIGPNIEKNPDLFTWAACHQHFHFEKFARFSIKDIKTGEYVLKGAKLSYCMEDGDSFFSGSQVPCLAQFTCTKQGIPRGRTDLYAATLDCQWLDVTDLVQQTGGAAMWYTYEVCTNIGRTLFELTYDNNCAEFPVYIPSRKALEDLRNQSQVLKYTSLPEYQWQHQSSGLT